MCGILSSSVKSAVSENVQGYMRKNEWKLKLKNDHMKKKKKDLCGGGEEPQILYAHQIITKISSSVLVNSKSRRNRSSTGKMCIRAGLFLLPICCC